MIRPDNAEVGSLRLGRPEVPLNGWAFINQIPQNRYFFMDFSFDQTLIDVWRQVLVENAAVVLLGIGCYPVCPIKRHLRKWTLCLTGTKFVDLNRTQIRNPVGQNAFLQLNQPES